MKKLMIVAVALVTTAAVHAGIVFTDDFSDATLKSEWQEVNIGSLDTVNEEYDYTHTQGTTRRLINYNSTWTAADDIHTAYFKADISNQTGGQKAWMTFLGTNPGNNNNYAHAVITADGTYEMFVNTTAAAVGFDNGAGWTGTLAAGAGVWTTDGGSSEAALTFRSAFTADQKVFGIGFANFANSSTFPTQSFTIDNVVMADTTVIPEPATFGLMGIAAAGITLIRRFRMI